MKQSTIYILHNNKLFRSYRMIAYFGFHNQFVESVFSGTDEMGETLFRTQQI